MSGQLYIISTGRLFLTKFEVRSTKTEEPIFLTKKVTKFLNREALRKPKYQPKTSARIPNTISWKPVVVIHPINLRTSIHAKGSVRICQIYRTHSVEFYSKTAKENRSGPRQIYCSSADLDAVVQSFGTFLHTHFLPICPKFCGRVTSTHFEFGGAGRHSCFEISGTNPLTPVRELLKNQQAQQCNWVARLIY